jgi:hypothetical protein
MSSPNHYPIFQLVYVSAATQNQNYDKMINEILSVAIKFNLKNNITGVLLYRGGIFLQLLEGDEKNVKNLFSKIQKDPRHNNVITLIENTSNSRLFDKWSMAYRELSDWDLKMVSNILSWTKIINKSPEINNELILKILSNFKENLAA